MEGFRKGQGIGEKMKRKSSRGTHSPQKARCGVQVVGQVLCHNWTFLRWNLFEGEEGTVPLSDVHFMSSLPEGSKMPRTFKLYESCKFQS